MKLPALSTALQIRFSDIDILGHVTNATYPQFFDLGRVDFFRQVGAKQDSKLPMFVVRNVNYEMLREIKFSDSASITTWCSEIGSKSMTVQHRIHVDGQCMVRATLILVCFDEKARRAIPVPEHWLASAPPTDIEL